MSTPLSAQGTMPWKNTRDHYGALAIAMHWLMLLLLIAVYACMELGEAFPRGSNARETMKDWHYALGLGVFVMVFVRLLIQQLGPKPLIHPRPAAWQRTAAMTMHTLLYLFMIVMPLLGWLILAEEEEVVRIPLLGWPIPVLADIDESLIEVAEELHEAIAVVGYWLVGLHTAAALVHHYLMRDNTLLRMLPSRSHRINP